MEIFQAYLSARYTAEHLIKAHAIEVYAEKDASYHIDKAREDLKTLAEVMGYDLVKREPAKTEEAA